MKSEVLVYRKNEIESRHRFSYAIHSAKDSAFIAPDVSEQMIYPRSSTKLFQVLPFITSGAYKNSNSGEQEVAVACGSHNAESVHVECVTSWLHNNNLSAKDLVCGASLPRLNEDIKFVYENKVHPDATYNNCSGKHTAMLLTCKQMGWDLKSYHHVDHPLQKLILKNIELLCNKSLDPDRYGIDGCGLPTYMMSLQDLAVASSNYAAFAAKKENDLERACDVVLNAIYEYPEMIAGRERLCSALAEVTNGRVIGKIGAEGVYMATIRDQHIGVALKIEDGAFRATEVALIYVLKKFSLLKDSELQNLRRWQEMVIKNTLNEAVGKIIAAEE